MRRAEIKAEFTSDVKAVWDVVTNNQTVGWRSDLERIEVSEDGAEFTEYSLTGNETRFVIKEKIYCEKYAFSMYHKRFTGYWEGIFRPLAGGGTEVTFVENIVMKNFLYKLLSYLGMNLIKMQETYIRDLRRELGEL